MNSNEYRGNELELFQSANNWKAYFSAIITTSIGGHVLEIGAGIGGTTKVLFSEKILSWTCVEPDPGLAEKLRELISSDRKYVNYHVINGNISNLAPAVKYDAILYIDVLEHIDEDALELRTASKFLKEGGRLVILSPAHQWLFSDFDKSIGHFRRYNRLSLSSIIPDGYKLISFKYLDSAGVLASLFNRLFLHSKKPTTRQIRFWDSVIIPVSRVIDSLFGYRIGKSVLGIWQKQ